MRKILLKSALSLLTMVICVVLNGQTPTINSFSPSSGPVGTLVTITGSNLSSPTNFTIGGVAAIVVSNTGTQLVGMVMPGATTGTISLSTSSGSVTSGNSFSVTATAFSAVQQGDKLVGTNALSPTNTVVQGFSVGISADGNTAIVGGPIDNNANGAVWFYKRNNNIWTQQGPKIIGISSNPLDINFSQGTSVAISADGNTAMISGGGENGSVIAFAFTRISDIWSQQGDRLLCSGNNGLAFNSNKNSNLSLSSDGNIAIIGGGKDNNNKGAVWIFEKTSGVWSQQGNKIIVSDEIGDAEFGSTVSISADGNTILVGGPQDNGQIGATWVFTKNGNSWLQQGDKLVGNGAIGNSLQGYSLAINSDGNIAAIGGINDDNLTGCAWIFSRNNGVWTQQGNKLTPNDNNLSNPKQGYSVAISADGNIVLLGESVAAGNYWIFTKGNNSWSQQGNKISGTNEVGSSLFGSAISLSADGSTAIVGGSGDNQNWGAVWLFGSSKSSSPSITSLSPSNGSIGTLVTINGSNLDNPSSINIGGVPAIQISNDGTNLVAMVMPGATTGPVSITTASGLASGPTDFTINPAENIITQQGNKLVANDEIGAGFHGQAVAISADGNTAIVGGFQDGLISDGQKGAVWIYKRTGSAWSQQGTKLIGSDGGNYGQEGRSVAISADGNTVLVGAPGDNGGTGAAFVFVRSGNTWTQQGLKLVGNGVTGPIGVQQGWSVSLSADGNTAVIGGIRDNGAIGAIWVFSRTNGSWAQQGDKLVGSGNIGTSYQGQSVAISADGNTIIDGGQGDNNTQGAAWIFVKSGANWIQQGDKLVGNGNTVTSQQGYSVAISADGNTAIIGGGGSEGGQIGASWVFTRTNGTWAQQGDKLQGTGNLGASFQGTSVSLSADGNQALMGGLNDDNGKGAMWLFTRTGETWTQQGDKMVGSNSTADARQGISVSISADGTTGILGGDQENSGIGAAWIFVPGSIAGGGGVSGGSSGGLESKSLGDAVVKRVYTKAQSNLNGPDDYSKMPIINNAAIRNHTTGIGTAIKLSSIMPDISSKGYTAYISTPLDIVSITNAKEVLSTDFTINQQCKAVAFATKTTGELYDHTKPICDRLKGASLISVEKMTVSGFDFVKYTLNNSKGQREYATSFSVGTKTGRNTISIQSTWLMKNYIADETMYNFQLWAASPELVNAMISDVIARLKVVATINSVASTSIPSTYILSGKRDGQNLDLVVSNNSSNTSGYFLLEDKSNESNISINKRQIPFTINTKGVTKISIPVGDLYESNISMFVNADMKDVVYMSDGTWSTDYNKSTTTINNFTISNDPKRTTTSDEFPLMRNVVVQGTSQDYVSIIKLLKGGAAETDLSSYKGLKITASGGYNLHVTLIKNSIVNWKDQYHADIKLDQNQKDYFIALDKFVSDASKEKIKATDITTVVFSIDLPGGGITYSINSSFSNISFTKVDLDYIASLESKEVQIYPNPTLGGKFICSFKSDQDAELTLHVNDITGRQIYSQKVSAIKGENKVPVTLTNSINGMHIISLEGANVKYDSKKLSVRY